MTSKDLDLEVVGQPAHGPQTHQCGEGFACDPVAEKVKFIIPRTMKYNGEKANDYLKPNYSYTSFSRGSSQPREQIQVSCIASVFFTTEPPGNPKRHSESEGEVAQSCPTLCDPTDCSLPSSSDHGILQARILEWVAIFFSRRSS